MLLAAGVVVVVVAAAAAVVVGERDGHLLLQTCTLLP
jgi:hypothetical protein